MEYALKRASDWFQIHADQRMKLMNFYIILLAGTLALLGSAMKDANYLLEIVVGISLIVVTIVFKGLDRRTAHLIKQAEQGLKVLETQISNDINVPEIELVQLADGKFSGLSYRQSFNILYVFGSLIGLFCILHGVKQHIYPVCLAL